MPKKTKNLIIIAIFLVSLIFGVIAGLVINERAIKTVKRFVIEKPKLVIINIDKTARITCYNDKGIMANGEYVYSGAVAVSDYSIPLNTKIYVEGYGIMEITDHTARRIQKRGFTIDIYSPDCSMKFGVKHLTYKILR